MRIIRQGFTELQPEISLFSIVFYHIPIFANQNFCHSQNEISTIIYHSIENFMGYKMMLNYRGKYTALKIFSLPHFSKTMKNPYILTLCLSDMCLFHTELPSFFQSW
jgi:hypothetical protein